MMTIVFRQLSSCALLSLLAPVTRTSDGLAQRSSVVGIVVDTASRDTPVAGAEVRLTHTDSLGELVPGMPTLPALRVDSTGTFAFRGLAAGVYRLDVRNVGYEPYQGYFVLSANRDLRPRVPLTKLIPRLAGVVTTASASYRSRLLESSGFRERERKGFGHFIDSRQIARLQPPSVLSLLRPYLIGCMIMYVNGARAAVPPGMTVDELVGVEIYRRKLQTPVEFQNETATCGSIVLWTAIPVEEPSPVDPVTESVRASFAPASELFPCPRPAVDTLRLAYGITIRTGLYLTPMV